MFRLRATKTASLGRSFGAALLLASLVSVTGASAATFTIQNGTGTALPASWNPSGSATTLADMTSDGIVVGTAITTFGGPGSLTDGLFVTPRNVILTFEFMGKEAGYTNDAVMTYLGAAMFSTTSAFGTTSGPYVVDTGATPGLIPFGFHTSGSGGQDAQNGGPIDFRSSYRIRAHENS